MIVYLERSLNFTSMWILNGELWAPFRLPDANQSDVH